LTDLAKASMQTQTRLAKQSADLTWATLAGDLDRAGANKAYVESVAREGARYWREAGELGVDYATDLVALGLRASSTVLREVAAAGGKPGAGPSSGHTAGSGDSTRRHMRPEAGGNVAMRSQASDEPSSHVSAGTEPGDPRAGGRRVEVILTGAIGGRAEGTITVANQHPRPRRIQLKAGDLVDAAGAVVGVPLEVSPTAITVPSGKERSVNLGVALGDASFSAGRRYTCTVEVSGGDEATIEVSIQVST